MLKEIQKGQLDLGCPRLYIGEAIPAKKLANAIRAYAPHVSPKDVFLLYDDTFFGGAKEGLLLTCDAVYMNCSPSKFVRISYADIQKVDFRESRSWREHARILVNQKQITLVITDNVAVRALADVISNLGQLPKRRGTKSD